MPRKTLEETKRETWPLLDRYKKAWTTLYDSAAVATLKEQLKKEITDTYPEFTELLKYFDGQCWQIEQRWDRPQQTRSIH